MMSQNKSKSKGPAGKVSDEQSLTDYTMPGAFPTFLEDSVARRIKFGAFLPLSPNSPGWISQPRSSPFPSPKKSEVDRDVSMTLSSPPTSPIQSLIQSHIGNNLDHDIETSDWYCPELWTRQKAADQEAKASKLIGDLNRIKATLEYYCANNLQYHSKWVRILADHITLLAEARGQKLNIAVAYHVSQLKAFKYRQQLEAYILKSEAKRAYNEEMEKNRQGSLRGKGKVARTDDTSISKITHPMSKKRSTRNNIPEDVMLEKGKYKDVNFKLVGQMTFLKH
ncbi:uncharacterized protein DFL_007667 [Arthrobotrys flagrans]|uniref:Uncharacterized protein n=1 Tax=Arthrobotrys flagrans TaxID=97331 RepID=A0A436ZX58_ARTFL|nr:hypothetical protein DFL_007667 [Arthrobotrys flagrans]